MKPSGVKANPDPVPVPRFFSTAMQATAGPARATAAATVRD